MNMSDLNVSDSINQLPQPSIFREQLQSLASRIGPLLEDFIKYFVLYHQNPTNSEYLNMYQNIIANMHTLMSDLFKLSNDVEKNTETINKNLIELNILIEKEKKLQTMLKRNLVHANNAYNGSEQMIDEYVEIYNMAYIKVFSMVLGVIILGFSMSKVFTRNTH